MRKIKEIWRKLKYWQRGGIITLIFLWLYIWILGFICNEIQAICVLSLFGIQAPAFYFAIFIENIYQIELSFRQLSWIFTVVTTIFWVIIGALIGLIIGKVKK